MDYDCQAKVFTLRGIFCSSADKADYNSIGSSIDLGGAL